MARRLAAILAADVLSYSRLMSLHKAGTLIALKALRRDRFDPMVADHAGRIVKLMGDGVLVEFASAVAAVECAVAIQTALTADGGPLRLRIGVNLGDVIIDGDDLYSEGVNIAARLEALSDADGICPTQSARTSSRRCQSCSSSRATRPSPARGGRWTSGRSVANRGCAMCWTVRCGAAATGCASRRN